MSYPDSVRLISDYIDYAGKSYEVINNGEFYGTLLKNNGARAVIAIKCKCVIARPTRPGERVGPYSNSLLLPASSDAENTYVLTEADENGNPIIDENGSTKQCIVGESELHAKFVVPNSGVKKETFLKMDNKEQELVQIDRNIAFIKPWGDEGQLLPQLIDAGGYINITDPDDVYGISEKQFEDAYRVIREIIVDTE